VRAIQTLTGPRAHAAIQLRISPPGGSIYSLGEARTPWRLLSAGPDRGARLPPKSMPPPWCKG
jgi:hypothetical protein